MTNDKKQIAQGQNALNKDARNQVGDTGVSKESPDSLNREAMSALMDNELSDFELRRLLRASEQNPELLAQWQRFGLMRAALQPDPLRSPEATDFADKVMARIEHSILAEGPLQQTRTTQSRDRRSWTGNMARFAVAASVTFAVFIGMQSILQNPGAGVESLPSQTQQLAVDAEAQQRLNDYIRSVTIPARAESQSTPYNILFDTPQLRPVSDRELVEEIERN